MANLDAAQRQFVVKRIAQYCPQKLIVSAFHTRWEVILKPPELAKLNPDFGGLLGPEDDALFRTARAEVDPNLEGIGSRTVQLIQLNWMFLDCNERNDPIGVKSIIALINSLQPAAPLATNAIERTEFVRRIVDPAEPLVEICPKS